MSCHAAASGGVSRYRQLVGDGWPGSHYDLYIRTGRVEVVDPPGEGHRGKLAISQAPADRT